MSMWKTLATILCVSPFAVYTTRPSSVPSDANPGNASDQFRSAQILREAIELQSLSPAERYKRLERISHERAHLNDTFFLCRMLFEPRAGGTLRGPLLGRPEFIGKNQPNSSEAASRWPLQPIAIYYNVPILIVQGYTLRGASEGPLAYLVYCKENGQWRSEKYPNLTLPQMRETVKAFINSLGDLTTNDKEWLLGQVEER